MEITFFILLPSISLIPSPRDTDMHMAFEVRDDSMADDTRYSYEHGDIVIARRLPPHQWWAHIDTGQYDFVMVHRRDGALLKKIIRHDMHSGMLTLHALNPHYTDFTIDISDLSHIYNVVKVERTK
jgi:SOS-response transcriptional repressor LexA